MIEFELDYSEFEEYRQAVGLMPELALKAAEKAMKRALITLNQMPPYPPPPLPGQAAKFWTPAQRRFFFAALRKGLLKVPYKRTGTLGKQFTTEVYPVDDGVQGEAGTATPYAPWVVGPDYPGRVFDGKNGGAPMYQARIHQGRWWQYEDEVEKLRPQSEQEFDEVFFKEFERLLNEAHRD